MQLPESQPISDGKISVVRMLHVAPEPCLKSRFKKSLGGGYLTADLFNPRTIVKLDITDIQYSDQSFDVVYCSHVSEHVPDDRQAMREFHRVLRKTGGLNFWSWAQQIISFSLGVVLEAAYGISV